MKTYPAEPSYLAGSRIIEQYRRKTPTSARLAERARGVFPSGITHDVRYIEPYGIYVTHAQAMRKWDVNGNEYVDYPGGHRALLIGHNHPAVLAAVQEQLPKGTHYGACVNPLMRKIREALELVGLPSDPILRHGNRRVVYGVNLAANFGDVLLALAKRPKYLLPESKPAHRTPLIAGYWRKRWLMPRVSRPEVLDAVSKHTLTYPIRHGARVPLPATDALELFSHDTV